MLHRNKGNGGHCGRGKGSEKMAIYTIMKEPL
jgi:hypothetical protein